MPKKNHISQFIAILLLSMFSYMQGYQLAHALHVDKDQATHHVPNGGDDAGNGQEQNCQICQFMFHHQHAQIMPMLSFIQQPLQKVITVMRYDYKSNTQIGFLEEFTNKGPPAVYC